jgi:hypothetical protein
MASLVTGNFWLDWAVIVLPMVVPVLGEIYYFSHISEYAAFVAYYRLAAIGGILLAEVIILAVILAASFHPEPLITKAIASVFVVHDIFFIASSVFAIIVGGLVLLIVLAIAAVLSSLGGALAYRARGSSGRECLCSDRPGRECSDR